MRTWSRFLVVSWVVFSLVMSSCDPGDQPVPPLPPAQAQTDAVNMGSDYGLQIFYDLESAQAVSQNDRSSWDLYFSSVHPQGAIFLNGAKRMLAYNTGDTTLSAPVTVDAAEWSWDHPSGHPNLSVFADWVVEQGVSKRQVYVVDLGLDLNGLPLGFAKVQVELFNGQRYVMRTAQLDGTNIRTINVLVNADLNGVALDLTTAEIVSFEPPKTDWDLLFSNYTETLWDGTDSVYYQVNGVLINRNNVVVGQVEAASVDSVSRDEAIASLESTAQNAIGYEWKFFDFDTQTYAVVPNRVYIIQSVEGNIFALRFLGFYSSEGVKGAPEFEFKLL